MIPKTEMVYMPTFKHWYAMKIHVMGAQGWELKMKVFSGNTRTQAVAQAKSWAKESGFSILDTKIHSFDSEDGANWQIEEWEKALQHD